MPSIKKVLTIGIVSLISIAVFLLMLVLFEFVLRMTPLYSTILRPEESKYYHEEHPTRVIDIKPGVKDGYLSFYGNTFPMWSNELGCFDNKYEGESPFIYLAGDSLTWGYAPFNKKWGTYLEQLTGIRVLKCAVTASGTHHQYLKAKDILEKIKAKPSIIVVGYFSENDAWDDFKFPQFVYRQGIRYENPNPGQMPTEETYKNIDERIQNYESYCTIASPAHPVFQRVKCYLYNNSVLYILTTQGAKRLMTATLPENILHTLHINPPTKNGSIFPDPPEEAYTVHFDSIKKFQELAQEQSAELVFALIPSREEVYPELFGTTTSIARHRAIDYFAKEHIRYIDLQPILVDIANRRKEDDATRPGDLYWEIEWHLNPLGNLAVGWAVSKYLYENNLLPGDNNIENVLQESYESLLHATE